MKNFIQDKIDNYCVPVSYKRETAVFGNEAEFRWKASLNSNVEQIKVFFNVTDAEHRKCSAIVKRFFTSRRNKAPSRS